jgi:hypothetical protein
MPSLKNGKPSSIAVTI